MLARYQNGCLQKTTRKDGAERWQFRWLEKFADGLSRQRKKTIGLVKDYPEHSKKLQVWLIKTERHPAFGVRALFGFLLTLRRIRSRDLRRTPILRNRARHLNCKIHV